MEIMIGDVFVEITWEALATLTRYVQYEGMSESGGILLGKYNPSKNLYIITEVTVPNTLDRRGLTFFTRKMHPAQKIINKRWKESSGTINYLGEWHTHGCEVPHPSNTDKQLLRTVISDQSNVWQEIIMIILGRSSCYIGIASKQSTGEIIACKQIEGEDYAYLFHRQEYPKQVYC